MKEYLDGLEQVLHERLEEIRRDQKDGTPVVCHNGRFVPEELIRACGAHTVFRLFEGSYETAGVVEEYVAPGMSAFTRANIGKVLYNHDPLLHDAGLIVVAFTDNHMSRMSELLEYKGYPIQKIGVPIDREKAIAFDYYVKRLRAMISAVSDITGKPMDVGAARDHLEVRNRRNRILREINEQRKKAEVPIGIHDAVRIHQLAFVLNRRSDLRYFEEILGRLKEMPPAFDPARPRLLIVGHGVAVGDTTVLDLLDAAGCPVVAEFFDEGMQSIESDVALDGDLLINYARAEYLNTVPMSTFQPSWEERFRHIRSLIGEYRVDGVIWYEVKNDEIYDMEYVCLSRWLEELGIPFVRLETDYDYSRQKVSALKKKLDRFLKCVRTRKAAE